MASSIISKLITTVTRAFNLFLKFVGAKQVFVLTGFMKFGKGFFNLSSKMEIRYFNAKVSVN